MMSSVEGGLLGGSRVVCYDPYRPKGAVGILYLVHYETDGFVQVTIVYRCVGRGLRARERLGREGWEAGTRLGPVRFCHLMGMRA